MASNAPSVPTKCEYETVYKTPYVDPRFSTLVQHQGIWFSLAIMPQLQRFEQVRQFAIEDDDIAVISFPKSGTTWLQRIVFLIVNGTNEEGDDEATRSRRYRCIELELAGMVPAPKPRSPRLLIFHMPYHLLPTGFAAGKGKIIYIARNPKDVCLSYYHFHRNHVLAQYQGEFADFFAEFIPGQVAYGPWQDHVGAYWDHRNDKNVFFVCYEDLHEKPEEMVRKIAEFLGRSLTEAQISEIVQITRFEVMKQDPAASRSNMKLMQAGKEFMRKGVIGDWKNYFTPEMEAQIDQCCNEPLKRRGLTLIDRLQ